ncbi:hypothetical protein MINTM006_34830 [Mycobacterium intracellulare]|uniref:hypothetical protein n=1 Tax=Mycobacterium intracellulare TaxID=1767 RepID=UPI00044FDB82|nr:hypothetical protein [Mycobacterium intracellulare]ETZ33174.1 hypothetical protein L843_3660 [Mycobacterium intracellulare MIN_061107_1834]BCO63533.1 hypothetical protein MINTM006_34830 [Mycobacterium intracellulare]BCP21796.1 hypothetical protein MINTM023_35850 [Mycobacterium intracellulare]BCP32792.1 hypothetical protein MINTM026_37620 [Mycobacterium intracellulare]BCP43739.1 hypothetical protein MINTMi27_38320 [Mycobacterium intracellulare]
MAAGGHCAEAVSVLASVRAELAENSEFHGEDLAFSAAEEAVLELVADAIDRKVDLSAQYADTDDAKLQLKLAVEIRLTESAIAKLLKQIRTDVPAAPEPQSHVSRKASQAAKARWRRGTS